MEVRNTSPYCLSILELSQRIRWEKIHKFNSKSHSQITHRWSRDSQGQKTFLEPSLDDQTCNYDTTQSAQTTSIYIHLHIYIYIYIYSFTNSTSSQGSQFGILETTFRRLSFSSFILSLQFFHYLQSILSKFIRITLYNFRQKHLKRHQETII